MSETKANKTKMIFFKDPLEFRQWLEKNHEKKSELLVGFYKLNSGRSSMTWSQSVDEALCYGWIDGVVRSIDEEKYCRRFTPRKSSSIWSKVNIKKVQALTEAGLMKPAGIKAFKLRSDKKSGIYSHENKPAKLTTAFQNQFKKNKTAWSFFSSQAPSYQKVIIHWIMTAKQDKTRLSRLEKAIKSSAELKRM